MIDTVAPVGLSKHACVRIRQRGYREADVGLVLAFGSECDEATVLTGTDATRAVGEFKRTIQRLERLRGTAVIVTEDVVASVYRPDLAKMRSLLRTRRRRRAARRAG